MRKASWPELAMAEWEKVVIGPKPSVFTLFSAFKILRNLVVVGV